MKAKRHLVTTLLAGGLALAMAGVAAAQKPATPPAHAKATHATNGHMTANHTAKATNSFPLGVANKLGMTADALESAYQAAKDANPKLTRGRFISANMVAHNLGDKNPAITTQAILDGLKSGKSLGQTLKGLGLSDAQVKEAEQQADRDIRAARSQR